MRLAALALLAFSFGPLWASPQAALSAPANARFEVATIKPGVPGDNPGIRFLVSFTRVETTNASVSDLMKYAYGVHADQIVGGADRLMHQGYAIQAVISADTPTKPNAELLKQMLRNLLADRFGLVFHGETKELPVYLLTAASPHLKPAAPTVPMTTGGYSSGLLQVNNGAPGDLAAYLQRFVTDRPVLDRTGITGRYDMTVHFRPDDAPSSADSPADLAPLFTAIREQLGLKLTAARAATPVLVIDRVTEPTPN